ncbi:TIGR02452 family protein [Taibaiella soli]|uniref:TIGR02452 family protein n=1 Tax=Taibaiella soli TaxID=1649169 RepID=A0A2W2AVD0_9BACT|nr:TIGR02452 family protein [Taibaiella soli]PZF71648.1 TIGR02452 family protein [Taibaiella soli]
MKQSTRITKAKETVSIIEEGHYFVNDRKIDIQQCIQHSIQHAVLHREDSFEPILLAAAEKIKTLNEHTVITVQQQRVLAAAEEMMQTKQNIGCLNFASANNPGGGFLGGAQAQEESLALSSALYGSLMQNFEMYEFNRGRRTYLYSDHMIYSPEVPVFRNDDGELLEQPYRMSFITSPATNIGAIRNNRPEEMEHVEATMLRRMDKVLGLFVLNNVEHLLLGAWGCGVFQNDPKDIAHYFHHYLNQGGKYGKCFKSIVFAVYDRSKNQENIGAFERVFS